MLLLCIASLLWSVSFALIKSSGIQPDLLSAARLGLAALVFAPVLVRQRRATPSSRALKLAGIGALQFGLMYVLVMRSYRYLEGHEVALLTITTPLFVVMFEAIMARRVPARALVAAAVAVFAALVLRMPKDGTSWDLGAISWAGFGLVAGANALWALGQLLYRRLEPRPERAAAAEFGWLYAGAFAVAGAWALTQVHSADLELTRSQALTIVYLGLVPSGLAFYLWNRGACRVSVGTLSVMNNLKIPLAIAVALAPPFREPFDAARLAASSALLVLALGIATWRTKGNDATH